MPYARLCIIMQTGGRSDEASQPFCWSDKAIPQQYIAIFYVHTGMYHYYKITVVRACVRYGRSTEAV